MFDKQKTNEIFKKYGVEAIVNIIKNSNKKLEYGRFLNEIGESENIFTTTSVIIFKNNKKARFTMDSFSYEKLDELCAKTIAFLDYTDVDENNVIPEIYDSVEGDFRSNELKDIPFSLLTKQFEIVKNFVFPEGIRLEDFSVSVNQQEHIYFNTKGAYKTQKDNSYGFMASLFGEKNGVQDEHYVYRIMKKPLENETEVLAETSQTLLDKITPIKMPLKTGNYRVVLDKEVVEEFLGILLSSFDSEDIDDGLSMLSGKKLGEKIFSEKLTIISDPNIKNGICNSLFDGEGVTLKQNILVKNGVFNSKFYDYKATLKYGKEFSGLSTSTNIVLQGETTKNFLDGASFLFTNLMAFHTIDTNTGKFTLAGEGYLLENSEKKGYVKNVSLSGNVMEIFSDIFAIGDDANEFSNVRAPSIVLNNAKIIV